MRVQRESRDGVTVLTPVDPLVVGKANAREFESAILEWTNGEPLVVLDASNVDFFESEGVDSLLSVEQRLTERKSKLVLSGLNSAIIQVFRLTGLDCLFQIYADVPDAVRGLLRRPSGSEIWH
jgi:anti-anti-sigma factor